MGFLILWIVLLLIILCPFTSHIIWLNKAIMRNKLLKKEEYMYFIFDDGYSSENYLKTYKAIIMIISYLVVYMLCVAFAIFMIKGLNKPYTQSEKMQYKKTSIEYKLSYYDKLFYDYIEEAKEYNRDVNHGNNKGVRFKVEDRTEYMINIDFYVNEFNNRKVN